MCPLEFIWYIESSSKHKRAIASTMTASKVPSWGAPCLVAPSGGVGERLPANDGGTKVGGGSYRSHVVEDSGGWWRRLGREMPRRLALYVAGAGGGADSRDEAALAQSGRQGHTQAPSRLNALSFCHVIRFVRVFLHEVFS